MTTRLQPATAMCSLERANPITGYDAILDEVKLAKHVSTRTLVSEQKDLES